MDGLDSDQRYIPKGWTCHIYKIHAVLVATKPSVPLVIRDIYIGFYIDLGTFL